MIAAPALDGRRVAALLRELLRHAPHYVPDLDLADPEGVGRALFRIGAHLGEAVAARLDRAPDKNLVAFLDRLGVTLLSARPARVAVTFKLASGLRQAVLVPSGARVTAPGDDEDIPFETTGDLLAIPGAVAAAYGVDPAKDAIYEPPPRFLEQEPRAPSEIDYEIVTFAAAGATRLQLSHVDQLEQRSVLRVGCRERVVVAAIEDGNIVKLAEPLEREAIAGTRAVAIRDFQVFDGIDVQQHVLYVGHADLLTVKERADIVLRVGLAESPLVTLEPLRLSWEFWTKDEAAAPGDQEQWRPLTARLDGTGGLVRSGDIILDKPKDLEIQEREVGGRTNRWIRAVLLDKVPPGSRALPEIDSLEIGVTSDGADKPSTELAAGIKADQGFHNATPLDVQVEGNVGFLPFGAEPRQFDAFYVASEEAFSKREAAARLNFDLDLQTLAAPAALKTSIDTRAYSIGIRRRLYELVLGSASDWRVLGSPADRPTSDRPQGSGYQPVEDSVPAAITAGAAICVLVRAEDSLAAENPADRVWAHYHTTSQSSGAWVDLGAPGATPARLQGPAADRFSAAFWQLGLAFVVGSDGHLYSRAIPHAFALVYLALNGWQDHGTPGAGVKLDSPPFVVRTGTGLLVFVNGGGSVHQLRVNETGTPPPQWSSLAPETPFKAVSIPFAQPYGTNAKVFVCGFDGLDGSGDWKLYECDTATLVPGDPITWVDLGWPKPHADTAPAAGSEVAPEAHAPQGFIEDATDSMDDEGKHIFVRTADNRLFERPDGDDDDDWRGCSRPGDPGLRDSPAVLGESATGIQVFAASSRNSLVTWLRDFDGSDHTGTTEYSPFEDADVVPELSWEYWNGRGWLSLPVVDETRNLLANGAVRFTVPSSIQKTEVAGQESFWIRARLVGGDYGRETFRVDPSTNAVVSEKKSLRPPKVQTLRIVYEALPVSPTSCLSFNNLDYLDQTAAAERSEAQFKPFVSLEKELRTLHLGFERSFATGPVRLLLDAAERDFDAARRPQLDWSFRRDRRWKKVGADDGTVALTRSGILALTTPEPLALESRFGAPLYWVKGTLRDDAGYPLPLLRAIFLNTVSAIQAETVLDELVGSGDGEPRQRLTLRRQDVLEGEDIRVREPLSIEEREAFEREHGEASVVDRGDDVGGTWLRWQEVRDFFDAGPLDRCYAIDRADGVLRFGDGTHGRVLPAGVDNVRAFYRTGGGARGNVGVKKIETLATAVAGIESVFNPVAAGGGSDEADTEAMLTIGPRQISHRDRAVSVKDFEDLAREASRQVAKVRCLATTNLTRRGIGAADPCHRGQRHEARPERGTVSLIVVPQASGLEDARPCPSLELRRAVVDYLERRCPALVAHGGRVVIRPPDYVEVTVEADVFVTSIEKTASVEASVRERLRELLHPLLGGPDGNGWDFGRPLRSSDVFGVLERIADVDRVEGLRFRFRDRTDSEEVRLAGHELLASGDHVVRMRVRES